jgi:hypothetical protein
MRRQRRGTPRHLARKPPDYSGGAKPSRIRREIHLKTIRGAAHAAAISLLTLLAACGGGGDSASDTSSGPKPSAYPFVPPHAGSTLRYATTYNDVQGNSYVEQLQVVTTVDPSGTYAVAATDPTHAVDTVGGITYRVLDEIDNYAANGALQNYVVTEPDGTQVTCTQVSSYAYTGQGTTSGYNIGETWNGSYTITCNGTPTTYLTSGRVLAVENVAVPAGTIQAVKVQADTSWTTSGGENIARHTITWRDPAHSMDTIKFVMTFSRTGNVQPNYVTIETRELQSRS